MAMVAASDPLADVPHPFAFSHRLPAQLNVPDCLSCSPPLMSVAAPKEHVAAEEWS